MTLTLPLLLVVGALLLLRSRQRAVPLSFGRVPLLKRWAPLPASAGTGRPLVWRDSSVATSTLTWARIRAVAGVEAREVLRHPVVVVGTGMLLFGVLGDALGKFEGDGAERYRTLTGASPALQYLGVFGYFGVHLCASRDRRAAVGEQLGATPVPDGIRTAGLLIGSTVLAGLAVIVQGLFWIATAIRGVEMPATPSIAQFLIIPACCLGAGTLGVMVGRWAPWWPAALGVMVAVVFVTAGAGEGWNGELLVPYVDLSDWDTGELIRDSWARANWGWHTAYLVGLSGMAAIGALLRGHLRDVRLLAAGAGAIGLTALAGVLQYP